MGGLHIEMALLSAMEDWLNGSGWVVMTTANVTTEGRADALQKGSYTSRAQWAHQVTAAALYILQKRVWGQSLVANVSVSSPSDWGWERNSDVWTPTWSSLAETLKSCCELVKCACKIICPVRCKCYKSNLPCTQLCACGGQCVHRVKHSELVTDTSRQ